MRGDFLLRTLDEHGVTFDPFDDLSTIANDDNDSEAESCIVLSSSNDDLDESEELPSDYDDYSDDACFIVEDEEIPESILPHDYVEID